MCGTTNWGLARALTDAERVEYQVEKVSDPKGLRVCSCPDYGEGIRKAKKLCQEHGLGPAVWLGTWDTQNFSGKFWKNFPGHTLHTCVGTKVFWNLHGYP